MNLPIYLPIVIHSICQKRFIFLQVCNKLCLLSLPKFITKYVAKDYEHEFKSGKEQYCCFCFWLESSLKCSKIESVKSQGIFDYLFWCWFLYVFHPAPCKLHKCDTNHKIYQNVRQTVSIPLHLGAGPLQSPLCKHVNVLGMVTM